MNLKKAKEGQERLNQAIKLLEVQPAADSPKSLRGTRAFLYAQAFQHLEEYAKARELYLQFIKDYTKHAELVKAKFKAAICVENSDDPEYCFSHYEQLIQDHPKSPQAPDSLIRMGLFLFNKKGYWASRRFFQRLLKNYPEHESAEKIDFKIGLTFILDEEFKEAGEHFEKFYRKRTKSELLPATLYWAGDAYLKGGMVEKSRENFLKVGKLYPDSKWAKFGRGRLTSPEYGSKEKDVEKNNFGMLLLTSLFCLKSGFGEEQKKEFEYWDRYTTGILRLIDDQPEEALQEFCKAGIHLLGEAEFEKELQRISKTASPDGAHVSTIESLKICSKKQKVFSRYFLAKALSNIRKEDNRTKVQLLNQVLAFPLERSHGRCRTNSSIRFVFAAPNFRKELKRGRSRNSN